MDNRARVLLPTLLFCALMGGDERPVAIPAGRAPTDAELTPAVQAAFPSESYAPGSRATLRIFNRARGLELQIFRVSPDGDSAADTVTMEGAPVTAPVAIGSSTRGRRVVVRLGRWPSGFYFARLTAADGRVGFAPLVLRPSRLGRHRVAVVLPTLTWQAYNLRDDNRDGKGDSWYACPGKRWKSCPTRDTVRLGRPFLNRGVPSRFRAYDLPFLKWLSRSGHDVDLLAQRDLEQATSAAFLGRAYDLIVFPGHHEYVTEREYDLVEGFRNLGGNLMFLSANNFFWHVVREGRKITKTELWRDVRRPEAALIGVQYRASDSGARRKRWILRGAPAGEWIFAGTGLRRGDKFASGGIEIDRTTKDSPPQVEVLAEMRHVFGPGRTAQMTYYETARGAKVFAAGAFTLAGSALRPDVSTVLDNLWSRLAKERVRHKP